MAWVDWILKVGLNRSNIVKNHKDIWLHTFSMFECCVCLVFGCVLGLFISTCII